jgi:hypothetical protein
MVSCSLNMSTNSKQFLHLQFIVFVLRFLFDFSRWSIASTYLSSWALFLSVVPFNWFIWGIACCHCNLVLKLTSKLSFQLNPSLLFQTLSTSGICREMLNLFQVSSHYLLFTACLVHFIQFQVNPSPLCYNMKKLMVKEELAFNQQQ